MTAICFNNDVDVTAGNKPGPQPDHQFSVHHPGTQIFFGQDSIHHHFRPDLFQQQPLWISRNRYSPLLPFSVNVFNRTCHSRFNTFHCLASVMQGFTE